MPCQFFRVQRMAGYLTMEYEFLCDAWLDVSADFIGRSRRGSFWQRMHDLFHASKHIAPTDMHIIHDHNVWSLSYRWYAIKISVTKFYDAVNMLEAGMPLRAAATKIVKFASSCSTS